MRSGGAMTGKGAAVALFGFLFVLCTLFVRCAAEPGAEVDFGTYRVKALKKLLDERGVECVGCVEKEHLVEKVKETHHLPLLSEEEIKKRAGDKGGASGPGEEPKMDQNDFLKAMNELSGNGQKFKMWTPDDIKKFGMEDFDKKVKPPSGSKKGEPKDDL